MLDTPDRKEPRSFEPPPWERDQFDELERARQAQREAEERLAAEEARQAEVPADVPEAEAEPVAAEVPGEEPSAKGATEDPGVAEMMFKLRAEEPSAHRGLRGVAYAVYGAVVVFGAILMIWGMVAFAKTQSVAERLENVARTQGYLGAGGMIVFGILLMVVGAWQVYSTAQKRGAH